MDSSPSDSEATRRRAVAWALAVTADTHLVPRQYERRLLDQYVQGKLTIGEVDALLETSIYHIFYRSQATYFPSEEQLEDLLTYSRTYNAQHNITGLLLYSDGRFAQLIEGSEATICSLFDRIQQDLRHQHVFTLSEGPGPQRWFPDWRMAFGRIEPVALTQAMRTIEAGTPPIFPLEDPHLQTLVEVFGLVKSGAS